MLDERVGILDAHEMVAVEMEAYAGVSCVSLEGRNRHSISEMVVILERLLALCEGTNVSGDNLLFPNEFSIPEDLGNCFIFPHRFVLNFGVYDVKLFS